MAKCLAPAASLQMTRYVFLLLSLVVGAAAGDQRSTREDRVAPTKVAFTK
jgi:hypothetical protein